MSDQRKPGDQDPEFGNDGIIAVGLEKAIGGHIRHLKAGYLVIGTCVEETKTGSLAQSATSVITHATPEGLNYRGSLKSVVTVRLDDNGALVQSYGTAGYALLPPFEHDVRITDSLVLSDESVVLSLGIFDLDGGMFDSLAIVKVGPDGQLDKGFGSNGIYRPVLTYPHSVAGGMAVQKDGSILITAETIREYNVSNSVLMRIDKLGSPDLSFGKNGFVYSRHGAKASFSNIKLDTQHRIYVTGHIGNNMAVFRFLDTGQPDNGFGAAGEFAYVSGPDRTAFVANLEIRENEVYVAASFTYVSGQRAAYTKLSLDGVLDPSFNGGIPLEILLRSGNSATHVVALDSGQTIGVGLSFGANGALTLSRINVDGTLDTGFGEGGSVLTDVPGYLLASFAEGMDDKLLIGGWVVNPRPNEKTSFWISRYLV